MDEPILGTEAVSGENHNFENRTLYHGDNLDFLRSINNESIDLIATDPPFNKGRDFHATPDSLAHGAKFEDRWRWKEDVHEAWIDQMQDDWPGVWAVVDWTRMTHSDGMAAFLCFMAVRLVSMHRVLKETGTLYLHCDPTASHYLKTLLDAIFGRKRFRNEIVWKRTSSHNRAKRFGPVHDIILCYAKGKNPIWNRVLETLDTKYTAKQYRHEDSRGWHRHSDLTGPGTRDGDTGSTWRGVDPCAKGRHWELPPDRAFPDWFEFPTLWATSSVTTRLDEMDTQGLIHWSKNGVPSFKRYLTEQSGQAAQDVIVDIDPLSKGSAERQGYPTQKPLALYRRLILASSNPGDVILDPFCGCATTPIAAELEGRRWIGADLWNDALVTVLNRLAKEVRIGEGERQTNADILGEWRGRIHLLTKPLERTDDGEVAAPKLKTLRRSLDKPTMSRAKMVDALIKEYGMFCQGCGFEFPHKGFVELDHNLPRSDGGKNDIENRVLLCGPCNRTKSNTLTLTGLRRYNKKNRLMLDAVANIR